MEPVHPTPREMKASTAQISALKRARNSVSAGAGMLWLSNPHQPPSFGMQWLSSTLPCCCPLPSLQSAPRTPHHHDARSCDILTFDKSKTVHEVLIASVSRSSTTLQTPLCTFAETWNIASSVCQINYHPIRFAIGVRKATILLDLVSPCQQRSSATRASVCRTRHAFWWTTCVNENL